MVSDEELQRRQENWQIYKYRPIQPTKENPHYNNSLGFHQSRAKMRLILGANRSGKTQTMMAEVAALAICEDLPPWWFNWPKFPPSPLTIWIVVPFFPKNPSEDARMKKLYHGENYLTREGQWVRAEPFIPPELVHWHDGDWTEVTLKNGNTISFKSTAQSDLSFASNQVDFIVPDEPTETNKWRELISRTVAVPHARIAHGLTDIYDTTDYLDEILERDDKNPNFEKFDFTTAGNPHTDRAHAESMFEFQTKEQRKVTELGMRYSDTKLCYPNVFRWLDLNTGREIKNFQKGTGNWIKPFEIPKTWTRYVIHDPGIAHPAAAVWFAVEPGTNNIFAYKCVHINKPGGSVGRVVDIMNRANNGDDVFNWYIDPKAAKQQRHFGHAGAHASRLIDIYDDVSRKYDIRWSLGTSQMENYARDTRINVMSSYLDPQEKSMPMIYFFDVNDGLDPDKGVFGMDALKKEFRRYKRDDQGKPIPKVDDGIYCCESACAIPLIWRGSPNQFGRWERGPRPSTPFDDLMNGDKPLDWREEG